MENAKKEEDKLKRLYISGRGSKHSGYQILPGVLQPLLNIDNLEVRATYEKERMEYIVRNIDIRGKTILDIGGNTGFFTFESYSAGAGSVDYYEGNAAYAEFVQEAVNVLGLRDWIRVHPEYYLFRAEEGFKYDVTFCLNVLHHLGEDFGNETDIEIAKAKMIASLNEIAKITKIMVFQMGYNWCGDSRKALFEHGTKQEMEDFLLRGVEGHWEVVKIGNAIKKRQQVRYMDKDAQNNERMDALGEFLNRPIFIMASKDD